VVGCRRAPPGLGTLERRGVGCRLLISATAARIWGPPRDLVAVS
jgi:hypothetical protein